jgi:hypothetical protein
MISKSATNQAAAKTMSEAEMGNPSENRQLSVHSLAKERDQALS